MKKELTLEIIKAWLKDSDWRVRTAAMNACQGKDIPLEIIKAGLKDSDWSVRTAAMNALKANGLEIPKFRTIEPPKRVYKKCLGGVIVVAEVAEDAQIRGSYNNKCRADKVRIVDIIGEFHCEKVGVSFYDPETWYFIGDEIVHEDFDLSYNECGAGFHFFCTIEEAQNY